MNYKLVTPLHFFKFNKSIQKGPLMVEWYWYNLHQGNEDNIRGFNHQELKEFEKFVVFNDINFGGKKNYHPVQEGEAPFKGTDDFIENGSLLYPSCLILKPKPSLQQTPKISNFMDIELLNEMGHSTHVYILPFGAIGKILEQ